MVEWHTRLPQTGIKLEPAIVGSPGESHKGTFMF